MQSTVTIVIYNNNCLILKVKEKKITEEYVTQLQWKCTIQKFSNSLYILIKILFLFTVRKTKTQILLR